MYFSWTWETVVNMMNNRVKIKICGITSLEDAAALDSMGIEYLGFNFWPGSKRYITPPDAASIISKLTFSQPIGLFVNEELPALLDNIKHTGIKLIQLHGDEDAEYITRVPVPVIKAVPHDKISTAKDYITPNTAFVLFDTKKKNQFGGTGVSFDWKSIQSYHEDTPYFLAGGLGPDNLSLALRTVTPYAVDLNSGVEISPGIKDIAKIRECMKLIRGEREK